MTIAKDAKSKAATITASVTFFEKRKIVKDQTIASAPPTFLNLVQKAIAKNTPQVKHKEQVSADELLLFFPLAKSENRTESRIGTLVITLFSGFFRPSEVLSLKKENLVFGKENVKLSIQKSKCNQTGAAEHIFISRINNENCPVRIMEEWMKKCPGSSFLFPSFSGEDRPWSYDAALSELKKATTKIGIKKNITLHSFRGSAATAAVEAGCSEAELDRACRWKSAASKKSYVNSSAKTTENASSILKNFTKK